MVLPPTLACPPRDVLAVVLAPWQSTCWRQQDLTPSVSSRPAQGSVWELWASLGGERVRVLPGWVVRGLICPIKSAFIQHRFREGDLRGWPQPCCKNWMVSVVGETILLREGCWRANSVLYSQWWGTFPVPSFSSKALHLR